MSTAGPAGRNGTCSQRQKYLFGSAFALVYGNIYHPSSLGFEPGGDPANRATASYSAAVGDAAPSGRTFAL